jgi:uncharacterized membrane protein YoaK (UPF0700 family)
MIQSDHVESKVLDSPKTMTTGTLESATLDLTKTSMMMTNTSPRD